MYKKENLNIKTSDIEGEIPLLSDFEGDNTICYNTADGTIFEKVPVTTSAVKRTLYTEPSPAVEISASVDSTIIATGQKVILTWSTNHAIKVYLNEQTIALSGTLELIPLVDTVYTLLAVNGDETASVVINISVFEVPTGTFVILDNNLIIGESTKLIWTSNNATIVKLDNTVVELNGELDITPIVNKTYVLDVINQVSQTSYSLECNVIVPPLPVITLSITSDEIELGETSVISWTSNYADILTLYDGVNTVNVELNGSLPLTPQITTTYIFNAINVTGSSRANLTLTVNEQVSEWRTTDSTGDPDIVIPGNSVVYIDTTYTGTQTLGTIDNPYNNWGQIRRTKNTTYLFKRGTTINVPTGLGKFLNLINISFGAYGTGDRPKIIATSTTATTSFYLLDVGFYNNPIEQQASSTRISGLDMSAVTPSLSNGVRGSSNLLIDNCYIHSTIWAWRSTSAPQGDPSRISNIKMIDCVIESTQDDGIYIQHADNIDIDNVLLIKTNQNYHTVGHLQTQAAGDGIQINAATKVSITNCKIDRSDTGCKFCLIVAGLFDVPDNYLIIDNNEFIAPIATNQGGAGLYISDIRTTVPIIYSNNKLKGDKGLTGVWYQSRGELRSINNVYDTLSTGLSKVTVDGSVCTSENDTFINCSTNTRGVTII